MEKAAREQVMGTHRPDPMTLPNGAIIRDQRPMPPSALARVLPEGFLPSDWYRLLNGFVFLWPDRGRLERHRGACRGVPQHLLVFDAARLLAEIGERVFLSPINSGNARRNPSARSAETLVNYETWRTHGWPVVAGQTMRSRTFKPAEILVRGHLPLEPYLLERMPF